MFTYPAVAIVVAAGALLVVRWTKGVPRVIARVVGLAGVATTLVCSGLADPRLEARSSLLQRLEETSFDLPGIPLEAAALTLLDSIEAQAATDRAVMVGAYIDTLAGVRDSLRAAVTVRASFEPMVAAAQQRVVALEAEATGARQAGQEAARNLSEARRALDSLTSENRLLIDQRDRALVAYEDVLTRLRQHEESWPREANLIIDTLGLRAELVLWQADGESAWSVEPISVTASPTESTDRRGVPAAAAAAIGSVVGLVFGLLVGL